mgnify:FL=1
MITKKSSSVKAFDGKSIHLMRWLNVNGKPKLALHINHGMAEYVERYDEFARFLCENNIVVFAQDHRGHGYTQTDGRLGFFDKSDGWEIVVRDIKSVHEVIKEEYPDIPYIMLGHSMGSFLSRTFAIKYPNDIDGLILSGSGYHPGSKAIMGKLLANIQRVLFKPHSSSALLNYLTFGSYNKTYENKKTKFDFLSRDEEVVKKYLEDPLCGFVCSNSFFSDLIYGLDFIHNENNLQKINKETPIYIFSGDADPVGDYGKGIEKVYEMYKNLGVSDINLKLYTEGRHEMLNEINKKEVYNDVLEWIKTRFAIN